MHPGYSFRTISTHYKCSCKGGHPLEPTAKTRVRVGVGPSAADLFGLIIDGRRLVLHVRARCPASWLMLVGSWFLVLWLVALGYGGYFMGLGCCWMVEA